MEVLFFPSLHVLNIDLIVFPLFIQTSVLVGLIFSVFASTALNVDLYI